MIPSVILNPRVVYHIHLICSVFQRVRKARKVAGFPESSEVWDEIQLWIRNPCSWFPDLAFYILTSGEVSNRNEHSFRENGSVQF